MTNLTFDNLLIIVGFLLVGIPQIFNFRRIISAILTESHERRKLDDDIRVIITEWKTKPTFKEVQKTTVDLSAAAKEHKDILKDHERRISNIEKRYYKDYE